MPFSGPIIPNLRRYGGSLQGFPAISGLDGRVPRVGAHVDMGVVDIAGHGTWKLEKTW